MSKDGYTFLVVDDEVELAEMMAETLEMEGHRAHQCHNGSQALKAFEEFEIDCVISDSNMPGMNGLELIEKLVEMMNPEKPCLFYLCSGDMEIQEAEIKKLGINRLILKPYDLFGVTEMILKDLNER